MKTYSGDRTIDGVIVFVNQAHLLPDTGGAIFSDTGFEWGYDGPGPRQLAYAILIDHLGDASRAKALVPRFVEGCVARLDNEWSISSADIEAVLKSPERTGQRA